MVLALPLGILSTVHRQCVRELHQLRGRQVATGHDERAPHPALNGAAEMGRAGRSTGQVTKLGAILRWRAVHWSPWARFPAPPAISTLEDHSLASEAPQKEGPAGAGPESEGRMWLQHHERSVSRAGV
jgi:hypothetical protein